jgi:hypothetical protein
LAAYVTPAGGAADALRTQVAEMDARIAAAAQSGEQAMSAAQRSASQLDELAAQVSQLSASVSDVDLADIQAQVASLGEKVAEGGGAGDVSEDVSAQLADLSTRLDEAVRTAETARAEAAELSERLASMNDNAADRDAARREVESARRGASMAAALSQIDRAMTLGQPFSEPLEALTEAAGQSAPAPLAQAAAIGAPTRESLKASYPDAAYRAISAMLEKEAEEDGGLLAGLTAKLTARVTGLPDEAIEGDSVTAVLSRARVSLLNGDIDATLAAIAALPQPAQDAMADWVNAATLRSAADAALSTWRNDLKTTL